MNSFFKTIIALAFPFVFTTNADSQSTPKPYFGATPNIKVSGKNLVDTYGNPVVLHGVMETPSAYFNNGRWTNGVTWADYNNPKSVVDCLVFFTKTFDAIANPGKGTYCNLFRLHLDPCWLQDNDSKATGFTENGGKVYDPHGSEVSGEANIYHFSKAKLTKYLQELYIPIIKDAIAHGLYVIVRPPGVFPHEIVVGDYYNNYLLEVWDIVSSDPYIKKNSGVISLELGNEPVHIWEKNTTNFNQNYYAYDWKRTTLYDFFQPIVKKIRDNGFNGIIWAPGTGYQAEYRSYQHKMLEDPKNNLGFAAHFYPGWYGSTSNDDTCSNTDAQVLTNFKTQIPVQANYPIVITEVDWSPKDGNSGHYDEHGDWVVSNFGTWGTGSTSEYSRFGEQYKYVVDQCGNVSWTIEGSDLYVDIDKYLEDGTTIQPAFIDKMIDAGYTVKNNHNAAYEACSGSCFEWFKEYASGEYVPKPTSKASQEYGNVKYIPENQHYCFFTSSYAAFIFDIFNGLELSKCADFTIKLGDSSIGYRLDIQLYDANGNHITEGAETNSGEYYIIGTEDAGTRFTTPQDILFNIQDIYKHYISTYPGCKLGNIRLNTVVPDNDQDNGSVKTNKHYITIKEMTVTESQVTAIKSTGTDITSLPLNEYAKLGNGKKISDFASNAYDHNIGQSATEVSNGGMIYGTSTVDYNSYIDLSNYKSITFTGTSTDATPVRFLFNRPPVYQNGAVTNGENKEVSVSANATINLEELKNQSGGYLHLHAIKANWGQSAKITSAKLLDKDNNKIDLTSLPFCKWDVKVEDDFLNEVTTHSYQLGNSVAEGGVIAGTGSVLYNNYIDLSNYSRMTIEGNGGEIRLLFNRLKDANNNGDLTEKDYNLDTNKGIVTIDLKNIDNKDFVHLNAIKVQWGNTATISSIKLFNDDDPEQFADYYINGAGYITSSVSEALADENATVIDLKGFTSKWAESFESANPNCLLFYSEANKDITTNSINVGSAFDARNLVKSDNSAWRIDLTDGYDFRAPVNINTVGGASYTRTLTTEWATICLPFELNVTGSPEVYVLSSADEYQGRLAFKKVSEGTVPAGSIILYRNTGKGETKLSGTGIKKTVDGFNIQPIAGVDGWYTAQSFKSQIIDDVATDPILKDYNVYGISGDKFVHATKKVTLKPFRTFYLKKKSNNAAKASLAIYISEDNEATGVNEVTIKPAPTVKEIYDSEGRLIPTMKAGLNIMRMSDGTVRKVMK